MITIYGLYISVIIAHLLQITFFHGVDLLWAAFMYCIDTCISDLWVVYAVNSNLSQEKTISLAGI